MARLLTGMWFLLIVSLSSMGYLMGNFLSERKHGEGVAPTPPPHALVPRNTGRADSAGLAILEEQKPAAAEPVVAMGQEEPAPQQSSGDAAPPILVLTPNTERAKPIKTMKASAPPVEMTRPKIYGKKMKGRSSLERRRVGARFGNRRLFR